MRTKNCMACALPSAVMYRVQTCVGGAWQFVCPSCLAHVKQQADAYRYGGTWKQHKRR